MEKQTNINCPHPDQCPVGGAPCDCEVAGEKFFDIYTKDIDGLWRLVDACIIEGEVSETLVRLRASGIEAKAEPYEGDVE